jgi:hypothetical protein
MNKKNAYTAFFDYELGLLSNQDKGVVVLLLK